MLSRQLLLLCSAVLGAIVGVEGAIVNPAIGPRNESVKALAAADDNTTAPVVVTNPAAGGSSDTTTGTGTSGVVFADPTTDASTLPTSSSSSGDAETLSVTGPSSGPGNAPDTTGPPIDTTPPPTSTTTSSETTAPNPTNSTTTSPSATHTTSPSDSTTSTTTPSTSTTSGTVSPPVPPPPPPPPTQPPEEDPFGTQTVSRPPSDTASSDVNSQPADDWTFVPPGGFVTSGIMTGPNFFAPGPTRDVPLTTSNNSSTFRTSSTTRSSTTTGPAKVGPESSDADSFQRVDGNLLAALLLVAPLLYAW